MKKLLVVLIIGILFSGCDSYERIEKTDYRGDAIHIGNDVYVKKMYIQGVDALVQCDKDGNILSSPSIQVSYMEGKVKKNVSTITPLGTEVFENSRYTFKCNNLDDCLNEINIVKKSIGAHNE